VKIVLRPCIAVHCSGYYVIDLSISPDDIGTRPTVDPAHIAEPGRVFAQLRAARPPYAVLT
jgi:hypothetical protein